MKTTIESQKGMVGEEIENLKKALEVKKSEDEQLKGMVKEYREKFNEFSKSLKFSKQSYQKHESSLRVLDKELEGFAVKKRQMMIERAKELGF